MDRETIVYEYRMNGMSEGDAEVHADIYCSKLDELATLRAENERLREALVMIEKKSRINKVNPDLIWGIAKEALK